MMTSKQDAIAIHTLQRQVADLELALIEAREREAVLVKELRYLVDGFCIPEDYTATLAGLLHAYA